MVESQAKWPTASWTFHFLKLATKASKHKVQLAKWSSKEFTLLPEKKAGNENKNEIMPAEEGGLKKRRPGPKKGPCPVIFCIPICIRHASSMDASDKVGFFQGKTRAGLTALERREKYVSSVPCNEITDPKLVLVKTKWAEKKISHIESNWLNGVAGKSSSIFPSLTRIFVHFRSHTTAIRSRCCHSGTI